ncbi:MAG: 50S ribosomal protein L23 [Pseudomonadota bacterium]
MSNERLMKVLLAPHVSEKSTLAADKDRQFVFKVVRDASKDEIKKAVEHLFSVEVDQVRVVNSKGKVKRFGQMLGRRSHSKKAYVKLKPGFDIEFAGAQ